MEVGKKYFEQLIDDMKQKKGVTYDVDLTADDLKELASQFKAEYRSKIGTDFPCNELYGCGQAVHEGKKTREICVMAHIDPLFERNSPRAAGNLCK